MKKKIDVTITAEYVIEVLAEGEDDHDAIDAAFEDFTAEVISAAENSDVKVTYSHHKITHREEV